MTNFIHRWLNPHCPECAELMECKSCEILKVQNDRLTLENAKLLERLIGQPQTSEPINYDELKPIMPKTIPWAVRRQMLENKDKIKLKSLEELEKEVLQNEKS
jgi:hypothetical protein